MKLDHFLTPHTKINSKCIKDLNARPETILLLEEDTGSKFFDIDIALSSIFLDMSAWARATKAKINKWNYFKLKDFAQQRKPSTK